MLRNGRAVRRLLARPCAKVGVSGASRGVATLIAPVASSARRAALAAARGGPGARALNPSLAPPPARASRAASTFLTEYDAHVAERAAENIAPKPWTRSRWFSRGAAGEPPKGRRGCADGFVREPRASRRGRGGVRQGELAHRGAGGHRFLPPGVQAESRRHPGHHAGRIQHRASDQGAGRGRSRGGRRGRAVEDTSDVRRVPRRRGEGARREHTRRARCAAGRGEWFTAAEVPEKITFTTFKDGETNTDDDLRARRRGRGRHPLHVGDAQEPARGHRRTRPRRSRR